MIENKSKIYNFRPVVGVCLFLIIGIFLSVTAIFNVRFYAVALIVTLCVFSAFLIRYILVKNKRHFIIALIFLVSTFIGAFLSYIPINDNFKSNLSGNFLVEGEIISVENIDHDLIAEMKATVTDDEIRKEIIDNKKSFEEMAEKCI